MRRDVFQAIADPTRRAILSHLTLKAMTPNGLAEQFDSSRQAISKHLKILSECELLQQQQQGREIFYTLHPQKLKEVEDWLKPFKAMWDDRFNNLDQLLNNLKTEKNERPADNTVH